MDVFRRQSLEQGKIVVRQDAKSLFVVEMGSPVKGRVLSFSALNFIMGRQERPVNFRLCGRYNASGHKIG